ncbi:LytR C-terminal domain-containing protein [Streptomyces ficellus]|uniref:LytR family transcriptional regulator n=1 Tax=Streptomyces ficellus TaxID=1977088 RepID=A0A6I6FKJ2_9ACTN|nr:LytR C-terminal domain-containing protein [Streptomyces ficellus]QGV79735.1 LytR family transcriptional regulator [Streptomyces ficellus]
MSMLTPPGMGGKYRITGNAYPRMRRPRRRRRIVVAALAAVVALGLAGWGTLQLIDVFGGGGADDRARTTAGPGCKPRKNAVTAVHVPLKPAQITVNVYNATPRAGLAKTTADELKKRGFAIGKVGNAPAAYDKKVPGAGMLLGGTASGKSAVPVLRTQLKGAAVKTDTRATADVDLIIGTAFKSLTAPKDATAALTALAKPAPAPSGKC